LIHAEILVARQIQFLIQAEILVVRQIQFLIHAEILVVRQMIQILILLILLILLLIHIVILISDPDWQIPILILQAQWQQTILLIPLLVDLFGMGFLQTLVFLILALHRSRQGEVQKDNHHFLQINSLCVLTVHLLCP